MLLVKMRVGVSKMRQNTSREGKEAPHEAVRDISLFHSFS